MEPDACSDGGCCIEENDEGLGATQNCDESINGAAEDSRISLERSVLSASNSKVKGPY